MAEKKKIEYSKEEIKEMLKLIPNQVVVCKSDLNEIFSQDDK